MTPPSPFALCMMTPFPIVGARLVSHDDQPDIKQKAAPPEIPPEVYAMRGISLYKGPMGDRYAVRTTLRGVRVNGGRYRSLADAQEARDQLERTIGRVIAPQVPKGRKRIL